MYKEYTPILGYEGLYIISVGGDIINVSSFRYTGKHIKHHIDKNGYHRVRLYKDKVGNWLSIHRLVYMSYKGYIGDLEINHKDGNKSNNSIENLETCTRIENMHHAEMMGLIGRRPKGISNKGHYKKISMYTIDGVYIKTFESLLDAKKEMNLGSSLSLCLNGKTQSCGGYKRLFENQNHVQNYSTI